MRLDRLHIQNFRCYEDATFDFQPGFNLVVGVNGSGKTSLLQGIADAFLPFGNAMERIERVLPINDVRFVIDRYEGRIRFERKFPVGIHAKGNIFGLPEWNMMSLAEEWKVAVSASFQSHVEQLLTKWDANESFDLPVLAFYRADRRWANAGITAEFAAQKKVSRFDGYSNWFDSVINLEDFETWFIAKTLERMQNVLDAGLSHPEPNDELAWVNNVIGVALKHVQNLRYDLRLQSLLVDIDNNGTVPFSELSDGQRGFVALIADIARRMCILNPHMGKDVLQNTSGVVIIDELDIHLHPAWQRNIVPALKQAFPKVQFIAASHSPQIIGSLKPEEVIVLNNGQSSHPRVTYGLDSSSVLEEVMDVAQREPEIEQRLTELFSALEDNDLGKAKELLAALKHDAPDLPEFAGAEALIRRKEILGK